ncbi:MAG: ScpA family protein [Patescibacteria group bacterium]
MAEKFAVRVGEFEGPLPLLLELVEKKRLSISRISLAEVADDFLNYVRGLEQPSKSLLAEFIVIASTLMLIKSISLLPSLTLKQEENEEIGDLERRLKLYEIIRDAAVGLRARWGRQMIFYPESRRLKTVVFSPTAELTVGNLLATMNNLIQSLPLAVEKLPSLAIRKIASLEETIKDLTKRIQMSLRMNFSDFVKNKQEKTNIIVSFLALLELCKRGLVEVEQGNHLADIKIETKMAGLPHYDII